MATDFFQRQHAARRSTTWLVAMFVLAVVGIVGAVVSVTTLVVEYQRSRPGIPAVGQVDRADRDLAIPALAGGITLLLITGGSLFRIAELKRGGGTGVAESLGGRRLHHSANDPGERRLLNVVEEMAIASGTPVPPVFLMDKEPGINAFAAGYSPSDAVLGVTRGCVERLTRDELQGVIAHEFSHVMNGDMRMNIRLMGVLNGILLLGLLGQFVLRMFAYSGAGRSRRRNSDSGSGGGQLMLIFFAVSITLIVIGFVGTFFGNLIKAAVSRQREFLADSSAVQFTRNPSGLANALRKIGGVVKGSKLIAPKAAEASHMYFSIGVWEGLSGLWATHPPLGKRIAAIDPRWDGSFLNAGDVASPVSHLAAGFAGGQDVRTQANRTSPDDEVPLDIVDHAVDQVGEPTLAHWDYAKRLLAAVPAELLSSTHEPYGARAVTFCLLMDRDPEVRKAQFAILDEFAEPDVVRLTQRLLPTIDGLDVRARLPLVDLALPALRSLSTTQYQGFARCFDALVRADDRLDLFEWVLSSVLMRHLRPQFQRVKSRLIHFYALSRLGKECSVLLSAVAHAGNSPERARQAFHTASKKVPQVHVTLLPPEACSLSQLRDALQTIDGVSAKYRGQLIDACAASICADEHVHWREAELLRGISDLLDCPMPPLLVNQDQDDGTN